MVDSFHLCCLLWGNVIWPRVSVSQQPRIQGDAKMTPRERVAELLKEELRYGKEEWYYISMVVEGQGFHGAFLVPGTGPTDAWVRLHALYKLPQNCSTQTTGPIDLEVIEGVDPSLRLRLLTKEEAESLGK